MKRKPILFVLLFLFCSSLFAFSNERTDTAGKTGKISLVLQGIKTEQANKTTAEADLTAAQNALAAQKPDLETKRDSLLAVAKKVFDAHDNKHEEGSSEYNYWQGVINDNVSAAGTSQGQINILQQAVDDAQKKVDEADAALKAWQEQLQAIGNVSSANWNCFFDGQCGDYGPTPEKGKGFVIVPNTGPPTTSGAPGIFTPLSKEYKDRHKIDNKNNVKAPATTAPQKGIIEQATDKVRGYFRDVIKKMQETKMKRVANAVLAVRG